MKKRNKHVATATTQQGHEMKVWVDRKSNTAVPTNWRNQAAVLGSMGALKHRDAKDAKGAPRA